MQITRKIMNNLKILHFNKDFFYYLFFFAIFCYTAIRSVDLQPLVPPDAYSYLWLRNDFPNIILPDVNINIFFFIGRSLTQRFIFYLLNNDFTLIFLFQSFLNFVIICFLFYVFKEKLFIKKIFLFIFLSLISFSAFFRFSPILIGPEPLYFSMFTLFLLTIFYYKGSNRNAWFYIIGLFFLFSKQTAPYIIIISIMIYFVITPIRKIYIEEKKASLILIIVAICSILITQKYDSSVKINAINNIFSRISFSEERTNFFITNYQLPSGQYLKVCNETGGVNSLCLGKPMYNINIISRNYEIDENQHPFLKWIIANKNTPYIRYYLANWKSTLEELNEGFILILKKESLKFFSDYIDLLAKKNIVNQDKKVWEILLLNIFEVLGECIQYMFPNTLLFVTFFNLIAFLFIRKYKKISAIILITIFSYAISYLGDGIEHLRHTYISIILYIVFTYLFILKFLFDFISRIKSYSKHIKYNRL